MNDVQFVVQLDEPTDGFTSGRPYDVLHVEHEKFLVIDDEARFVWLSTEQVTPVLVERKGTRLFDLQDQIVRRKLEQMAGKSVLLTTWENLGFDPDEVNAENMLIYRGVVDHFDGQTLFLRRTRDDSEVFSVLPKVIASLEEAP